MIFTGYNPYAPPRATPPHADGLPDVGIEVFRAAADVHATHLSANGKVAYDERRSSVWYCGWDEEVRRFGSWYKILSGDLPADAVRMP